MNETTNLKTAASANKPRWDLMPFDALDEVVRVMAYGAAKYKPRDWEAGALFSLYFAACCRHMFAWWAGEDKDPESGLSHLAHAACCILMLLTYVKRGKTDYDDRNFN